MFIATDDLVFIRSQYYNDTSANGGKIGTVRISSGVNGNIFPNVSYLERQSGITRYRKVFLKNENPSDVALEVPKLYLSSVNSGEDTIEFTLGNDIDIQSEITSSTNWYGAGRLYGTVVSGETQITIQYKRASGIFSGENIQVRISDGTNSEFHSISGEIEWIGSNAIVNLDSALLHDYSLANSVVSSVVTLDDLTPTLSNFVKTSTNGNYDTDSYPFGLFNIGTISENWTLTFLTASTFSVVGAVVGSVGTGSITSTFAPANGSSYYFSIDKNGWSGTWAAGDTITFTTKHAAQALWFREIVPAGCSAHSNNVIGITWEGESI